MIYSDSILYIEPEKIGELGTKYGMKNFSIIVYYYYGISKQKPEKMMKQVSFSNEQSFLVYFNPKENHVWGN